MTHFPVSNSNLSAPHLAIFLQQKYSLGTDTKCRIIRAGINDTYAVTGDSGRYVFRVYSLNWRSEQEIKEEIRLLNMLKEQGISVSYPIADAQGEYIQLMNAPEGDRYAILYSYAPGEKLHNYDTAMHCKVGQFMARFHQVTNGQSIERVAYTPEVLLVDSLRQIETFVPADTDEMKFMQQAQQYLLDVLSSADISQLRKGIVHMDMWFDNMNIDKDGTITVFDFDFSGNGWLCMDVAYYLMQLQILEPIPEQYQAKKQAFLEGYESITPLTDEEKRLLPALGVCEYFFYLGVQCQRFDNYSSIFLSETYLKRYISQRVKRYFDFCEPGPLNV
jgi:Ser/Thr protein kinase RdoA (MazF antagonist)